MPNSVLTGLIYMIAGFLIGSVLGAIRGLVIAPLTGDLYAVLIEMPVILAALWFVCGLLVRQRRVAPEVGERVLMGSTAFVLLVGLEIAIGMAFGARPDMILYDLTQPARLLGLAGQALFGLFPLLRIWTGADKPLAP